MADSHFTKTVSMRLSSNIPLRVVDDEGNLIGAAYLDGFVGVTLIVDKHHPAALDLETDNGLGVLKLHAHVEDNTVDGSISIGGVPAPKKPIDPAAL